MVKVKKKMHHEDWLGFTGDGKTVGSGEGVTGWRLMRERSVRLEDTPSYLLEAVDPEIIHKIEMRQKASWTRLSAAFPGGERRQVLFSGMHVSVDSSNLGQCIKSYKVAKCCHLIEFPTGLRACAFCLIHHRDKLKQVYGSCNCVVIRPYSLLIYILQQTSRGKTE